MIFSCFPYISPCYTCDPGAGPFWAPGAYFSKHGTGQLDKSDATYSYHVIHVTPRAYLNKHGTGQLDKSDATYQISMP